MRKPIAKAFGTAVIASILAMPVAVRAQNAGGSGASFSAGANERHPVVHRSIHQLERVKEELSTDAAHDFGGHKANAIQHIDEAIAQLRMGVKSDKQ
jgi:hypothetical protein